MNGHHLKLLKELSENNTQSQRELSKRLGLSLGSVNYVLSNLVDAGLIKAKQFKNSKNKIAYMYLLTPAGIKSKMQLSRAFLKRKLDEYEMLKIEIEELLNLGSFCIYPRHAPQPMKEDYLLSESLEPTNEPYAIAKITAIKLCRYYNEQYGANYISVMPTNLFSPNDNFNLERAHVLPALIRKFHLPKLLREKD